MGCFPLTLESPGWRISLTGLADLAHRKMPDLAHRKMPAHFVTDYSAHTSKETREYLTTMEGRFAFVFKPKHGSWLNLVESFFSKLTLQMLREIRVTDKQERIERIYKYFADINDPPIVCHWEYHINEIDPEEAIGLAN